MVLSVPLILAVKVFKSLLLVFIFEILSILSVGSFEWNLVRNTKDRFYCEKHLSLVVIFLLETLKTGFLVTNI